MPILTNSRLEKFAQLPAGAKFRPSEVYRQCGYTSRNADVNCQDLLANAGVAARIAELMAGNAQECQMTREEALDWLVDIIKIEGVEEIAFGPPGRWPGGGSPKRGCVAFRWNRKLSEKCPRHSEVR
jgi:Terminase small subunit